MIRKTITVLSTLALAAGVALAGSAPASAYTITNCIQGRGYISVKVEHNWFEKVVLGKVDGYQIRYGQYCA